MVPVFNHLTGDIVCLCLPWRLSRRFMSSSSSNATAISRTLFRMLNARANSNWEGSLMYLGFSQWFGHNKLRGSEKWCLDHSEVERQDAIKIFDHLANRRIEEEEESSGTGAQPLQVQEPATSGSVFKRVSNIRFEIKGAHTANFDSPTDLWKKALEEEKEDSRAYFAILTKARELKDYVTEEFILSNFINDQFRSENILEEILENTLLVTKSSPDLYFELDRNMPKKPHS